MSDGYVQDQELISRYQQRARECDAVIEDCERLLQLSSEAEVQAELLRKRTSAVKEKETLRLAIVSIRRVQDSVQ